MFELSHVQLSSSFPLYFWQRTHEKEEDDNEDDGDDYNDSDNEEDEMEISENSGSDNGSDSSSSEDDRHEGNMKEYPDSTAFGRAFRKIMKKKVPETTFTEAMVSFLVVSVKKEYFDFHDIKSFKELFVFWSIMHIF